MVYMFFMYTFRGFSYYCIFVQFLTFWTVCLQRNTVPFYQKSAAKFHFTTEVWLQDVISCHYSTALARMLSGSDLGR